MKLKRFSVFFIGLLIGFSVTIVLYPSYFFSLFNPIDKQRFRFIGAGQILYEQKKEVAALFTENKPVQSLYTPDVSDSITLYRSSNGSLIIAGKLGQIVWLQPNMSGDRMQWDCLAAPPTVYNCQ